ncbi:hypothetical protein F2Q68_00039046 [Brassica cretica]|uniref:Uncharacterized protein n=2 Tax=Brassica cretica TaxID=69181 RepID=A0A8S9MG27_BRACR|nr:hypothetical protein F2Q68_00039046 [Brassica cretica]KAF3497886.1 hypothetical protein DY000_02052629 [Brassica cretica]
MDPWQMPMLPWRWIKADAMVHMSLLLIQWFKLERKRLPVGDAARGTLVTSEAVKYQCNDSEVIHLSRFITSRHNGVVKVE